MCLLYWVKNQEHKLKKKNAIGNDAVLSSEQSCVRPELVDVGALVKVMPMSMVLKTMTLGQT